MNKVAPISSAVFALALSGCASLTPETAMTASDWDICKATMGKRDAPIAQQEQRRRGLDCAPLYQAIVAEEQSRRQGAAALLLMNGMNRPRTTSCTSTAMGSVLNTTCY